MLTRFSFILLIVFFTLTHINAQVIQQGDLLNGGSSGNANSASLSNNIQQGSGGAATTNVNQFTGSLSVGIPIFAYSNNYGDFGVSLSYNATGVKVDQVASEVGLGWSLNAFGKIVRYVKDFPDEHFTWYAYTGGTVKSTMQHTGSPSFGYDYFVGKNVHETNAGGTYAPNPYIDGEYDDFYINIGNINCRFNLGKNGKVFTIPKIDIKVEIIDEFHNVITGFGNNDNQVYRFVITDPLGAKYYFSHKELSRFTFVIPTKTINKVLYDADIIKEWYVDSVVFPNQERIKYEYNVSSASVIAGTYEENTEKSTYSYSPTTNDIEINNQLFSISKITYPNDLRVDFLTAERVDHTQAQAITAIHISQGTFCNKFLFNYVYSESNNSNNPYATVSFIGTIYNGALKAYREKNFRLILNSIEKGNCQNAVVEPYFTFIYNNKSLPARGYKGQDFYGYYRKPDETGNSYIPQHPQMFTATTYGINRYPNINYAVNQSLLSVQNATEGKVSFEYEEHSYTSPLSTALTGFPATDGNLLGKVTSCGLRIKSITQKDGFMPDWRNDLKRNYTYTGGQIFLDGMRFFQLTKVGNTNNPLEYKYSNFISTPGAGNIQNFGYSTVTVQESNLAGEQLSKEVNTYQNINSHANFLYTNNGGKHYYEYPFANKQYLLDHMIGCVKEKIIYDANNRMIQKNIYEYQNYVEYASVVDFSINRSKYNCLKMATLDTLYREIYFDEYRNFRGKALLTSERVFNYVNATDYVVEDINYDYDFNKELLFTKVKNSTGKYVTVYNYTTKHVGAATAIPGINAIKDFHLPLAAEHWNANNISDLITAADLYDAVYYKYEKINGVPVLKETYGSFSDDPQSYATVFGSSSITQRYKNIANVYNGTTAGTNLKKISEVLQYDNKLNPVEIYNPMQNTYQSAIYDTVLGQLIAACGQQLSDIAYTGFENGASANIVAVGTREDNVTYPATAMVFGKYAFAVTSGAYSIALGKVEGIYISALQPGKEYVVGLWAYGSHAPSVSGPGITWTVSLAHINDCYQAGWKYYEGVFKIATAGELVINNGLAPLKNTMLLDEIKIHPMGTLLPSTNYIPLFGAHTVSGANGTFIINEYDAFGNSNVIRDQHKNILEYKRSKF